MIRRLGVASVAKYVGVAHAILGVIYGFIAMFGGLAVVVEQDQLDVFSKIFASIGAVLIALLVIPGVLFLVGWLYGAVFALIANLILNTSEGIEVDFEKRSNKIHHRHNSAPSGCAIIFWQKIVRVFIEYLYSIINLSSTYIY